jgi:hypothetical protein
MHMARMILMDEFHLILKVASKLPAAECRAIHRALDRPLFQAALSAAVRQLLRHYPSLRRLRVRISR